MSKRLACVTGLFDGEGCLEDAKLAIMLQKLMQPTNG